MKRVIAAVMALTFAATVFLTPHTAAASGEALADCPISNLWLLCPALDEQDAANKYQLVTVGDFFDSLAETLKVEGTEMTYAWKQAGYEKYRIDAYSHNLMNDNKGMEIFGFVVEPEGDIAYARLSYYMGGGAEANIFQLKMLCIQLFQGLNVAEGANQPK